MFIISICYFVHVRVLGFSSPMLGVSTPYFTWILNGRVPINTLCIKVCGPTACTSTSNSNFGCSIMSEIGLSSYQLQIREVVISNFVVGDAKVLRGQCKDSFSLIDHIGFPNCFHCCVFTHEKEIRITSTSRTFKSELHLQ